jgi:hypothetical protein
MTKKPKRLTAIKLHEISVVDNGAGGDHRPQSRPAIVLMKRDKPHFAWGSAYNLVPVGDDIADSDSVTTADTSLERALQEIEMHKRAVAKFAAATPTEVPMEHMSTSPRPRQSRLSRSSMTVSPSSPSGTVQAGTRHC